MEIEELMKQLAQGGINVQGDLVMKKEVQYEVSNVEAGGIGIQVVNGTPADMAGVKQAEANSERGEKDLPEKRTPGPHKQFLFIEGDASWEEQGKRRDPSRENAVVRRRERDRLTQYLRDHKLGNRELTCTQGDTLNDVVACFLVEWQRRKLIADDFAGTAVWRFLTEECGMKSAVTSKAYGKEIKEWMRKKSFSYAMLKQVSTVFL